MISKGEAISRLKKMGVTVADDQSIVTILLPKGSSLSAGIKDIKEKMKAMDYDASFCIKQKNDMILESGQHNPSETEMQEGTPKAKEPETVREDITEEDIKGSLLSMDDDGQFTLGGFGMDF